MTQGFVSDIPISVDTGLLPSSNGLVPSQLAVKTYVDAAITPVSTDTGLAPGSDSLVPSQLAVKTYVDAQVSGVNTTVSGVSNLGIAYNAGTGVFTVQGADAALSASNPAYVTLQSKSTPGELVTISVTADQSFIDDVGASEIIGNLFGVTTGIAWGEDCPFYIYAVSNDDENAIAFMISRIPHRTVAPATVNIGAPDDAVADTQGSFFSIDNIDETLYDTNPCICIGSFRMQMAVTTNDWTVQALAVTDGIGLFNESKYFVMPISQNGAASGKYFDNNGGTAMVFTTNQLLYYISKTGFIYLDIVFDGDGGTDGVGAVPVELVPPLLADFPNKSTQNPAVGVGTSDGANTGFFTSTIMYNGSDRLTFYRNTTVPPGLILYSNYTAGGRDIDATATYPILIS